MPLMLTWMANNMGGSVNRGVGSALQISFGNIGGIVSSLAFQAKDAPRYTNGYIICISFLGMTWLLTFVYYFALKHENAARDGGKRDHLRALAQHEELGDKHVLFSFLRLANYHSPTSDTHSDQVSNCQSI
jgi:phosphotransferase system  glucose/maltose/N-acetylglucosamine-specific IIC component